jgi:hypothetical protein
MAIAFLTLDCARFFLWGKHLVANETFSILLQRTFNYKIRFGSQNQNDAFAKQIFPETFAAYTCIHTHIRRIPFYDIVTALQLYVLEKCKHETRNKWYQIIERGIFLFPFISYPTICMWHIYDLNAYYISYIYTYAKFE